MGRERHIMYGNLGVGEASPRAKIDAAGTIFANVLGSDAFYMNSAGMYYGAIQNVSASVYGLGYSSSLSGLGTTVLSWTDTGKVGVGTTSPAYKLDTYGTAAFGTNRTDFTEVESDGTLKFNGAATVWNDANVGALVLQTGGTLPGIVEWLNGAGGATGIYTRGFAVGEQGSGSIEIPHDYKEGSNITFHIHWGANDAPTGVDDVKWQLTYSVTRGEAVFPASTTIYASTSYDTRYELKRSDFAAIVGTNFKIGDQFNFTIARVIADGDAFAGECLVETLGFHYEADTVGSRTISAK